MKREKMKKIDSSTDKKSTAETSEVYALLNVINLIKIKEMEQKKGRKLSDANSSEKCVTDNSQR